MPRIAIVHKEKCNPQGCGGYLCIRLCPVNRGGHDCIFIDTDKKVKIDEKLCTGCGICPNRCPFGAIDIINLPEQLERPIHRYGRNGFHLYNLPVPMFGKVVGVLGVNGIGKSTAIQILAGVLKPNLGQDAESDPKALINFFKGSEAQIFFEKLRKGEIKVSYKPQQVDLLPKSAKGTVLELLKKVDEKKELDKIAELLELKQILNTDISQISGGELQRVAIAATVLKKANVYIFDEPTSFLDIKQRIKIAEFIKHLANENTAVMVVEHDLLVLDTMADLIHLMYGKTACYGVVSLPKTARVGMNTYLEGFIRDENMRFRDYSIKFSPRPPLKSQKVFELTSWKNVKKKLGQFLLEAKDGTLHKSLTVGVLGENGIGKTTFVKMLANVLKYDSGEISKQIKVSYKPQNLSTESKELVMTVLHDAVQNYELQLVRPLGVKELLLKPMNSLSGGELQRVAIAHCLSQPADLYLLDEPSAYLDVEQRLIVSKVLRDIAEQRGCTLLVVDHDLLFIDYLAEKLLVFEGEPAKHGLVTGPFSMEDGMNHFLSHLGITMRRDKETLRPRINKLDSRLDREQKEAGKLYYT
ncbi:ribosome biogenesis/translation initiation ATPase RLI [Candidatus Woesearchaeota archaeon]|nr:ribosome biogenesis/translation initiation ATPase RLI [Candidatus Woesearchaeota archaeon]